MKRGIALGGLAVETEDLTLDVLRLSVSACIQAYEAAVGRNPDVVQLGVRERAVAFRHRAMEKDEWGRVLFCGLLVYAVKEESHVSVWRMTDVFV